MAHKITIEMVPERETKNTWRYAADPTSTDPAVTTLYIVKDQLPSPRPEKITVTLEMEDA